MTLTELAQRHIEQLNAAIGEHDALRRQSEAQAQRAAQVVAELQAQVDQWTTALDPADDPV